ncbi:MAG: class I SAM-dependent methyltransferase [Rhodothalassiaceae bacterium]
MGMSCILCACAPVETFETGDGRRFRRCPVCALVFLDPAQRLSLADERAHYRLHRNDPEDPRYRAFLSRLADPLCKRLRPGAEGLDFGCGPGPTLSLMLAEAGHVMHCHDPAFVPDETLLRRSYDFVTLSEVLEHIHRPAEIFDLLGRLVRPGGTIAIMTGFLESDIDFERWHYRRDPTHVAFYGGKPLGVLARARGWRFESPARNIAFLDIPDAAA